MNDGTQNIIADLTSIMEASSQGEEPPGQLDTTTGQCEHYNGGSEFNEPLRLRRIKERSEENYKQLEDKLEGVVGRYLRPILRQKFEASKKYISQVLPVRDDGHRRRVLQRLRNELIGYPGKLFIWTDEGDHIHFVHDCPYSNGTCRCRIFKGEDFRFPLRSPMRRLRSIEELDRISWTNVLLYFILSKWPCESQIWIGGRLQGPPSNDQIVRWRGVQAESREILGGEDQGTGHHSGGEESDVQNDRNFIRAGTGYTREKRSTGEEHSVARKKGKFERISETVAALLSSTYCIPAENIHSIYAHDKVAEMLFNPDNQKFVKSACELFTQRSNHLTFEQFREIYEHNKPVFYANNKDPFEYYHDRDYSANIIRRLLEWQLGGDEENIKMFLVNIREWFNKKGWNNNPKCNSISILGPPNSGKSYFFDMVAAIAFNVGHIGRVNNKTNTFALQEIPNRRMVVGNEVSMEEGAMEDFKKMCEGTAFNVKVKYKGDQIFTKTPVLLMANSSLQITNHPHFENVRNVTMRWSNAPFLAESEKKPYPICIFDLFDYYNIHV